jgi:hypothetical protein
LPSFIMTEARNGTDLNNSLLVSFFFWPVSVPVSGLQL